MTKFIPNEEFKRKQRIIRHHFKVSQQDVKKPSRIKSAIAGTIGGSIGDKVKSQESQHYKQKRIDKAIISGRARHV